MRLARRMLKSKLFSLIMCTVILSTSCSKRKVVSDAIEKTTKKLGETYEDSEDVFRSIMFLNGEYADRLSEFDDLNPHDMLTETVTEEDLIKVQDSIIYHLNQNHPGFIEQFASDVQASEYSTVYDAIEQAGEYIGDVVMNDFPDSSGEITQDDIDDGIEYWESYKDSMEVSTSLSYREVLEEYLSTSISQRESNGDGDNRLGGDDGKIPSWEVETYALVAVVAVASVAILVFGVVVFSTGDDPEYNDFLVEDFVSEVVVEF